MESFVHFYCENYLWPEIGTAGLNRPPGLKIWNARGVDN